MSIAVTIAAKARYSDEVGVPHRRAKLTITGLAEGANTVPHGLPYTPHSPIFRPGANGLWGETAVADATNLYITVGTGGATAGIVDVEE